MLASGSLTPMMRQYLSVKAEYPAAIVLFRMGDFFETFYDDAEECARLLDLTLTKRSKEKNAVPMAGVPHHAIENYIARLVDLGRIVVMVDQVEDPKKAKGLVKREVTKVISPGTYVNQNASGRNATYLVALSISGTKRKKKKGWGLSVLDVSTGEFRATSGDDIYALVDEIGRLGAKELILKRGLLGEPFIEDLSTQLPQLTITPLEDDLYTPRATINALTSAIGVEEVSALEKVLPPAALDASGIALKYAEETQLRSESFDRKRGGHFGHIDGLKPYLPGDALIIDSQARQHLELFRSSGSQTREGSLLGILDCAITSMGGRLIGRWLARPERDVHTINQRLNSVQALIESPSQLDRIRDALKSVHDLERLLGRVVMARSNPRDIASLRATLACVPELLAAAGACRVGQDSVPGQERRSRLDAIAATDVCADVCTIISEAIVEAPPTDLGNERVFVEHYDKELDRLIKISTKGKQVLSDIEKRERERTGISSLKVKFNRVFGYFIEVTKANIHAVPDDYVRKQTTVNSERYFTAELKEYEEQVLTANEKRMARETELFGQLVKDLGQHARRLKSVALAIAELDSLASFAFLAEREAWSRPVVDHEDRVDIIDGRHPVLEAFSLELGERFVPNDVCLSEEQRLLIVTGPNMAGKSTIMRQTALIVILGQMGSFVPAKSAHIGVVDRVFTRVGASDDLSKGRSTFMVEMTETARILRSASARSLIILDEIGRGTSTFDGLSIAWAVAEFIHDTVCAKTMFATHYHELTEICRDKPHAKNFHVAVKQFDEDIVFLRKLLEGPTNRSYGVQVARLAGLPKKVVGRARTVLARLEEQERASGMTTGPQKDQMHLFRAANSPSMRPEVEELLDALQSLDVDDTTPREALAQLAEWQKLIKLKES